MKNWVGFVYAYTEKRNRIPICTQAHRSQHMATIKGVPRARTIDMPQELDETGSDLVLNGLCIAEHDLSGEGDACERRWTGDKEMEASLLLTSTALSSSGV